MYKYANGNYYQGEFLNGLFQVNLLNNYLQLFQGRGTFVNEKEG